MHYTHVESPVGRLLLAADEQGLRRVEFAPHVKAEPGWQRADAHPLLGRARRQLDEYFAGKRRVFELPLAPEGTPFQQKVWRALCEIPYGETATYAQQARRIGNPKAVRAVGLANGKNPLAIVIPCHRVIGSDGSLTGYGGGLHVKRALLALEGAMPHELPPRLAASR